MKRNWRAKLAALLVVCSGAATAMSPSAGPQIPAALQDWQGWVLADEPTHACFWQGQLEERRCRFVGDLQVNATAQGARFSQVVQLTHDGFVELPGDQTLWPQQLQVQDLGSNAAVAATLSSDDEHTPRLFLAKGSYRISAQYVWQTMPRALPFPNLAPPVQLTLNGQLVPAPQWDDVNLVLSADPQTNEADSIKLRVFRLLQDGVPQQLVTQIQLSVSGKPREYVLPLRLPAGFVLSGISGDMPYKLLQDGALKLSISPMTTELTLTAVRSSQALEFVLPASQGDWPDNEVWALQQSDVRHVQGTAPSIDPLLSAAPESWRELPQFQLSSQQPLQLSVLSTGMQLRDRLTLQRDAWLQPERDRWLVQDQLQGERVSSMQLRLLPPLQPGRVETNGQAVLIGNTADEAVHAVELRSSQLNVRLIGSQTLAAPLALHNIDAPMQQVQTTLHLPDGWRALAVSGVESSSGDWLSSWQLWDIFIVLLIAAASWRLLGAKPSALLVVWLVLSYQQQAPVGLWLHALIVLAVLSVAHKTFAKPTDAGAAVPSRALLWLRRYYAVALLVLAAALLPYITHSLRSSVYPQLPAYSSGSVFDMFAKKESVHYQQFAAAPEPMAVASAPMLSELRQHEDDAKAQKVERIRVTGSRLSSMDAVEVSADLSAQLLTGPAVPQWRGRVVYLGWQGELQADQAWQLYLVPSWATRLGDLLSGLLGLVLLLWFTAPVLPALRRWLKPLASLAVVLLVLPSSPSVQAQDSNGKPASSAAATAYPSAELLAELKKRLTPAPECAPQCLSIERMQLQTRDGQPQFTLTVHVAAKQLFKLPSSATVAQQVLVDDKPALLQRDEDTLWVALEPGVRQVSVWLRQGLNEYQLSFEHYWHVLDNQQSQWRLLPPSNIEAAGPYSLILQRPETAAPVTQVTVQEARLPELLQVSRSFNLSLRSWIHTRVSRLTASDKAVELLYPLLPGERVENSWPMRDGHLVVQLNPGETEVEFRSQWQPRTPLELVAPPLDASQTYLEVWSMVPAADWHIDVEQVGASLPLERRHVAQDEPLLASYLPWPGEQMRVHLSRPTALKGDTLTVSQGSLSGQISGQASSWSLSLQLLTSQAQNFALQLPTDASLQQVSVNGQVLPLKLVGSTVNVPLGNGQNALALEFRIADGASLRYHMPQISAPVPLNNLTLLMQLPDDRWLLALGGDAKLDTVLLFWGGVLLSLLLAVGSARLGLTPLTMRDALLLFLGFATLSVWVPVLWVVALVIAGLAGQASTAPSGGLAKFAQFSRLVFIAGALIGLCSAVPTALLSAPDMQLVNTADDWQAGLRWFADGVTQSPAVWAFSLPQWSYQLVMLLWALWLASAILRWLPWCWQQLTVHGFWPASSAKPSAESPAAAVTAHSAAQTPPHEPVN